jgi:hypothetical protein
LWTRAPWCPSRPSCRARTGSARRIDRGRAAPGPAPRPAAGQPSQQLSLAPGRVAHRADYVRPPGDRQWRERNPRSSRGWLPARARLHPAILEAAPGGRWRLRRRSGRARGRHGQRRHAPWVAERPEARWLGPGERGIPVGPAVRRSPEAGARACACAHPTAHPLDDGELSAFLTTACARPRRCRGAPAGAASQRRAARRMGWQAAALRRPWGPSPTSCRCSRGRASRAGRSRGARGRCAGGVEAGYRLIGAFLAETGEAIGASLEPCPRAPVPGGPRTRANVLPRRRRGIRPGRLPSRGRRARGD